jgi:hypothetical protein
LAQILGCLSDQRGNPQLKRRYESGGDSPVSQSQQTYHGALWEQDSFAGGPLQRQIAAKKLEPPTLMQVPVSTNSWDFTPQTGDSAFMTGQVDNTLSTCITKNSDSLSFLEGTNSQPSLFDQEAAPHLFDPHLQPHAATEDSATLDPNLSDNIVAMWANVPISFRCVGFCTHIMIACNDPPSGSSPYEWNHFLANAIQVEAQPNNTFDDT